MNGTLGIVALDAVAGVPTGSITGLTPDVFVLATRGLAAQRRSSATSASFPLRCRVRGCDRRPAVRVHAQ